MMLKDSTLQGVIWWYIAKEHVGHVYPQDIINEVTVDQC